MSIIKDIVYGTQDCKNQVLDIYLPEEVSEKEIDVLVYFHGGGLHGGDKTIGIHFERAASRGIAVVSANYRMYPTADFPDFLEDAALAVKWAREHMGEYCNVKRIFVGGSSAGAYITAMLAYDKKYLGMHGINTMDIAGYIIDSAQMTTHFYILKERGVNRRRIAVDEAAPLYHINENTEFPNAFVVVSDNDMPCRMEQNLVFLKTTEMFQCPEGKIQYKLMEGFSHCGYTNSEMFADIIVEYMESI